MSSTIQANSLLGPGFIDPAGVEAAIQNVPEGVILAGGQGTIFFMNQAALDLYGFADQADLRRSSRDMKSLLEFTTPEGHILPYEEWPIQLVKQGQSVHHLELRVRRKDTGRTWNGLYSASAIRSETGEVVLIAMVVENLGNDHHALFLSRLATALLALKEPAQIFPAVSQKIGTYLKVDRCFLHETNAEKKYHSVLADYHPGLTSIEGVYPLQEYPPELAAQLSRGTPAVIADVRQDPTLAGYRELFDRYGTRAILIAPYLRDGVWWASLVACRSAPYNWPPEEIAFLLSAADLAWLSIDNARLCQSLQQSEERLRLAAVNSGLILFTNDLDLRYTWIYSAGSNSEWTGMLGKRDRDFLPAADAVELMAVKRRVIETGIGAHLEFTARFPSGALVYDMSIEPVRAAGEEVSGLTGAAIDITERRKAEDLARRNADQLEASRLILTDREVERLQIAQRLHDGPLQMVMVLAMELNEAMRAQKKTERQEKLNDVRARLQMLAQDLRTFCSELRPPALAPFGLEKAIRSHLETFQAEHPELLIQCELMPDGQTLTDETRLAMFRIYQELLSNIVRHAKASRVSIHLTLDEAQVELEIQDDGRGFELPPNWLDLARQGHFGLVGILERVEALDGRVFFRSSPGRGTLARVVIPHNPEGGRKE